MTIPTKKNLCYPSHEGSGGGERGVGVPWNPLAHSRASSAEFYCLILEKTSQITSILD